MIHCYYYYSVIAEKCNKTGPAHQTFGIWRMNRALVKIFLSPSNASVQHINAPDQTCSETSPAGRWEAKGQ